MLAYIAIQLPKLDAVQRRLAVLVSGDISQKLEIPISIEKLRIENLNDITLTNVLVLDKKNDTLSAPGSPVGSGYFAFPSASLNLPFFHPVFRTTTFPSS